MSRPHIFTKGVQLPLFSAKPISFVEFWAKNFVHYILCDYVTTCSQLFLAIESVYIELCPTWNSS